jgi:hypothetical protein
MGIRSIRETYNRSKGYHQGSLQKLADDIIRYADKCIKYGGGDSYCIEACFELTGHQYWVHFSGCRVSDIIAEWYLDENNQLASAEQWVQQSFSAQSKEKEHAS